MRTLVFAVALLGCFAVGLWGWAEEPLVVPPKIVVGELFTVTVNVPHEVLHVFNLTCGSRYKFNFAEPGQINLCFVRPCDRPCECVPQQNIIVGYPGDQILFALEKTPREARRFLEPRAAVFKIALEILTAKDGQCLLRFTVEDKAADKTCDRDRLPLSFVPKGCPEDKRASLMLTETEVASGVFMGEYEATLSYAGGKFTITYKRDKDHRLVSSTFSLPVLPVISVRVGARPPEELPLVQELPREFVAAIPERIREGCLHQLYQVLCMKPEDLRIIGNQLWIIVRDGCRFSYAAKRVEVLKPVHLVVRRADGKGLPDCRELTAGVLTHGTEYVIEAKHGLAEGVIIVVRLGDTKESVKIIGRGSLAIWRPGRADQGLVAILYVDPYFCHPPALIFTVE